MRWLRLASSSLPAILTNTGSASLKKPWPSISPVAVSFVVPFADTSVYLPANGTGPEPVLNDESVGGE